MRKRVENFVVVGPLNKHNRNNKNQSTMFAAVSRQAAIRAAPLARRQQKRGIVNWMVNYPDKVRFNLWRLREWSGAEREVKNSK